MGKGKWRGLNLKVVFRVKIKSWCLQIMWSCSQPTHVLPQFSFSYLSWHWSQCFTQWIHPSQLLSCQKHNPYVKIPGFLPQPAWCTCLLYVNKQVLSGLQTCASQCKLPHRFHSLLNGVTVTVAIWANFQLSHPLLSRYPSSRLYNWDPGAPSIIRTLCGDDISLIWLVMPVPNRIRLMVKVTTVTAGILCDHPSMGAVGAPFSHVPNHHSHAFITSFKRF